MDKLSRKNLRERMQTAVNTIRKNLLLEDVIAQIVRIMEDAAKEQAQLEEIQISFRKNKIGFTETSAGSYEDCLFIETNPSGGAPKWIHGCLCLAESKNKQKLLSFLDDIEGSKLIILEDCGEEWRCKLKLL